MLPASAPLDSPNPELQGDAVVKNLFEAATVNEVKKRMESLRADSERKWGSMNPAQALAHCTAGLEMALGETRPPRMLIGRIIGRMVKARAFPEEEPMRRHSPTVKVLIVNDERNLEAERERLGYMIDRFA